jgi:hypothetical protein
VTFLRTRLDHGLRFRDLGKTRLAPRQFLRDRHAIRRIRLVRRLGLRQQIGHLGLQLRLDLARVLIGQRAVTAGIGVDLGPVEPHRAHLQNAHLARQKQNLDEKRLDLLQKPPPERRDRVVIGVFVRRDEAERHAVVRRPLQLAARKYPRRIAINQKTQQKRRVIRRRARPTIATAHRTKIKPIDNFNYKPRQMALRQPLVNRGRQKKSRIAVYRPEVPHLRNGMSDYAKTQPGLTLQIEDAKDDVSKQLSQIQNFIANKVDAIIVNPG